MNDFLPALLNQFHLDETLSTDPLTKVMAATGFLGADRDQPALIVLEPISFQPDQLPKFLQDASLNLNLHNDAYSSFTAIGPASYQLQLTYPATSQHINKHIQQNYHRIIETAEVYKKVVKPYFDSIPADRTQWVRNIIQDISEQDRIIYNDPDPQNGFILLPDIKWDGSNVQSLYIQAIARNPMIKSLRDLTTEHLPLLQRISTNGVTTIAKQYNVNPSLIRCYVHYHPSYYHFHVHLVHTALTTSSCVVGRAILLDDIIENIQLIGDYYQKRSIYYYLPENHDLYGMLKGTHECN